MAAHRIKPSSSRTANFAGPLGGIALRMGATALNLVLVLAVVGFALLAVGPRVANYRTLTMLSGSMTPAMPTGSVVIEVPIKATDVHVGDVITISLPDPDKPVVTHRVIDVKNVNGVVTVHTKGDANAAPDLWASTITSKVVWKAKAAVPYVGHWISYLRSRTAHRLTAVVLPGLIFLAALWSIWGGGRSKPSSKARPSAQAA